MFGEKKKMRDVIELARVFAKLTHLKMSLDHVLADEEGGTIKKLTLFVSLLPDKTYFSDIGTLSYLHEDIRKHVETMKKRLATVCIVKRPRAILKGCSFESISDCEKESFLEVKFGVEKQDEIANTFMKEYIQGITVFVDSVAPYFYQSAWTCPVEKSTKALS